jgi:hypothetical protein
MVELFVGLLLVPVLYFTGWGLARTLIRLCESADAKFCRRYDTAITRLYRLE